MAMNPSRLGQAQQAGDDRALFRDMYAGEVLTAFYNSTVMRGNHREREVRNVKSAEFPVTGKKGAAYHTAGQQLTGTKMDHDKIHVTLDGKLVADSFFDELDELMNYYDVRSIYTEADGQALAQAYDINVMRMAILASRAAAPIADHEGGSELVAATAKTDMDALVGAAYTATQTFAEKNISDKPKMYVRPAQYYMLVQHKDSIDTDYNSGNGDYAKAKIHMVGGLELQMTNNLPQDNVTGTWGNKYDGNFTNVAALVMTPDAVATLKLLNIAVEQEYLIDYQGWLSVSKMAVGHGILRPACAQTIVTAAS